jgi:hypothetical protein
MTRKKRNSGFPHADKSFPSKPTPWSTLQEACGTTPTESELLSLARDSILSLWSFPNVYTDEGRRTNCSDGKELCDLLVIFGDDVLLFSDKNCAFPSTDDLNLAWNRWYRRAIEKSAKQLAGAEAWIRRFPDRVFLDAKCSREIPVPIPPAERRRVHLIAVAHGSQTRAAQYWDSIEPGSSSSLIIDTQAVGRMHENKPFSVGWPLESKRFIHVLDGATLSLVLRELDTVSDFISYLSKKQDLFEKSGCDFLILGEEELLAAYLTNIDPASNEQRFESFEPGTLVVLGEGYWKKLNASARYRSRARANEISYIWDDLIEYQASHVIHGSSELMMSTETHGTEEDVLRVMASESRLARRLLGESIHLARTKASKKIRVTRCVASGVKKRVYAMVALPYLSEQTHADYREYRQYFLHVYCQGALLQFPGADEVLGIAFEPYNSAIVSVDFLYIRLNGGQFDAAERAAIEATLHKEKIWQPSSVTGYVNQAVEFPL